MRNVCFRTVFSFYVHVLKLHCTSLNQHCTSLSMVSQMLDIHAQMTTVCTQNILHTKQRQLSYTNLQNVREKAFNISNYSSQDTRQAFTTACLAKCGNRPPYPWQLDAAEAFYLGLDCSIVAGMGVG